VDVVRRGQPEVKPEVSADVTMNDGSQVFASSRGDHQPLCLMADVKPPILPPVQNPWLSFHPEVDVATPRPLVSPKSAETAAASQHLSLLTPASGWEYCVDHASKRPFWVNHETKTITLKPPPGHASPTVSSYTSAGEAESGHRVKMSPTSHRICSPFLSSTSTADINVSRVQRVPLSMPAARSLGADNLSRAATRSSSKSPPRQILAAGDGSPVAACSHEAAPSTTKGGGGRCGVEYSASQDDVEQPVEVQPAAGHDETQSLHTRVRISYEGCRSSGALLSHRAGGLSDTADTGLAHGLAAGTTSEDTVNLYICDGRTRGTYRVKTTAPLSKVFDKHCENRGLNVAEYVFTYDDSLLIGSRSLESLGITNSSTITIHCSQILKEDGVSPIEEADAARKEGDGRCGGEHSGRHRDGEEPVQVDTVAGDDETQSHRAGEVGDSGLAHGVGEGTTSADTVKVYIRTRETFRVKTTVPLSRVFNKYCEKRGLDIAEQVFTYKDARLSGSRSLDTLGIKNPDTITIHCSPINPHAPSSNAMAIEPVTDLQDLSEDEAEGLVEKAETFSRLGEGVESGIPPGLPGLQD
jgi:hypothetical protein